MYSIIKMDFNMIEEWTKEITDSVGQALESFIKYIPTVVSSIVLIILGWFLAKILSVIIYQISSKITKQFSKKRTQDSGLKETNTYIQLNKVVKKLVFWFVFLFFAIAAIATLGIPTFSNLLFWMAAYLPKLISALLIIFLGIWTSDFVFLLIKRNFANITGFEHSEFLSQLAKWLIIFITIIIAIGQAGIESTLLIAITGAGFAAMFGALALAFALGAKSAFGNIINAFYIKKHYSVGDKIKITDIEGEIVDITNSYVIVKLSKGNAIIPAQKFAENISIYS